MNVRTLAALVALVAGPGSASAGDIDCERARDLHVDFKAVLDDDPGGKPQYETVRHGSDGMVTITRWSGGERRLIRKAVHGVFGKTIETYFGGRSHVTGFSHSIEVYREFPLRSGQVLEYRISAAQLERLEPKFSETKLSVGAAREVVIGACKLQGLEIVVDARGLAPGDPMSRTALIYVPALEYAVETVSHFVVRDKSHDVTTKVRAIEAWSE